MHVVRIMKKDWNPFLHDGPPPADNNARRHGRLMTQDVGCSLGTILDLSASGLRIRSSQGSPAIGEIVGVTLTANDEVFIFTCATRWVRRAGFFKHEVGLEFLNLSETDRRTLTTLARACAHNETVRFRKNDAA